MISVPRSKAHRSVTEQDEVVISQRHDHSAQDEIIYLTEKLLPDIETKFTTEFTRILKISKHATAKHHDG
ncbi:hypothetical protein CPLU01_03028 [Colletotrichum plurivorum]|uniref:Uncharacterized protein n=1 Tax=Colletotrichum plurivorum TaxID=2175906 RepID=A0A8H6KTI8_9PEZI|nr:hypothetical protein CPLU01_03028 [Colletotrichum plurivorum]